MATKFIELACPNCGASTSTSDKTCSYCSAPIVISTFNSVYEMSLPDINKYASAYKHVLNTSPDSAEVNNAIAMCYLKLKLHKQALIYFENAISNNFDNSETYFYAAIALLGGKKAFLASRFAIDKIDQYLSAAESIEPKGIYYYFHSYIKYDYFERKHFITSPHYKELFQNSIDVGFSEYDVVMLFKILDIERPAFHS